MHRTTSLILLAALAACGVETGDNAAKPEAAGAPSASPTTAAPADDEARRLAEYREDVLRGCIGGGRDSAPPGTPVEAHCTCAVDRVMAGRTRAQLDEEERSGAYEPRFRDAMRACIAAIPR